MSSPRPYKFLDWDAPNPPSREFLDRWLTKEGLVFHEESYPSGTHTPEMKFPHALSRVLVTGCVQVAFPGYGVIELHPGDRIDIDPDILHDLLISGPATALMLVGNK